MKNILLIICLLISISDVFGQEMKDCSICSKQILTEEQVKNNSKEELALLRNEIYARKGYNFDNFSISDYFENQKWYKPVSSNEKIQLSEIEQKNIAFLKSLENKIQKKRDIAISDLEKLRTALNENNMLIINKFLGGKKMNYTYDDYTMKHLKKAMNCFDFEDIHWNKSKGIYSVSIDNGFGIFKCEIVFENNEIMIKLGDYGFSEIFKDFAYSPDAPFMSENEFSIWWIFDMTEKGIILKIVNGAG